MISLASHYLPNCLANHLNSVSSEFCFHFARSICVHYRYLQKTLLARKSKLKTKHVTHNWSHKLRVSNHKASKLHTCVPWQVKHER